MERLDSLHGHGPTQQTILLDDILVFGQGIDVGRLLENLLAWELLFRQQSSIVERSLVPRTLLRRKVRGETW